MRSRTKATFDFLFFMLSITWVISVSAMFIIVMIMAWFSDGQVLVLDVNSVGEMWFEVGLMIAFGGGFIYWGSNKVYRMYQGVD